MQYTSMRAPNSCGICGLMGHNRRNCRIQRLRDEGEQMGTPLTTEEEARVKQELRREFNSTPQGIRWAEHMRQLNRRILLSQQQSQHIREAHEREARLRQAREQQAAQQREAQQQAAQQQATREQADFERFEQLEEQARQRLLAQQRQQEARAQRQQEARAQQGHIDISHTFSQIQSSVMSLVRRAERETTNRIRRESQTQQIPKSLSLKMVSDFSGYQEEDSTCCICYENDPIVGLPCKHSFCGECTVKFAKKNQNCPLCRSTFHEVHIPCNITPENFNKISCKLIL
jgi:hypothetical protein